MGWKTSMILIESNDNKISDTKILRALGIKDVKSTSPSTLDECLNTQDGSIAIGRIDGNIVICDGYYVTEKSLEMPRNLRLCKEEKALCKLFPSSEIVAVACHSTINYHGYSLIKAGKKLRLKTISDGQPLKQYGEPTPEEAAIYSSSFVKKKANYWHDDHDPDEDISEDQMMEDFTFAMAARRLGARLDAADGEAILAQAVTKYFPKKAIKLSEEDQVSKKTSWKTYAIIFALIILWQIFRRFIW